MTHEIRLGIVGINEGNGHPYSWAAIFNGFNAEAMASCPFPTIPDYLSRRSFPQDAIAGARVTHVWTQSRDLSEHIAAASRINHVVGNLEDMIGAIDGVLLARDDAENHFSMARPFLAAGLPVYVDKPLALSSGEARRLFDEQRYEGQIFSCSALKYAREFRWSPAVKSHVGALRYVRGTCPKSWEKYGIHIIDAAMGMLGRQGPITASSRFASDDLVSLNVAFDSGLAATFTTTGSAASSFSIELFGDAGEHRIQFEDTFLAFRSALLAFVSELRGPRNGHREDVLETLAVLEAGLDPDRRQHG